MSISRGITCTIYINSNVQYIYNESLAKNLMTGQEQIETGYNKNLSRDKIKKTQKNKK